MRVPAMASSEAASGSGRTPRARASSAHDIELIDAVEAFDLQANGQADLGLELAEGCRLRLEQPLDHIRMGEDQQLAARLTGARPQDLAKDLIADRFRRLHEPAPRARRARLTQQVLEALARALARHLHQPER